MIMCLINLINWEDMFPKVLMKAPVRKKLVITACE